MNGTISILLVDDHALTRDTLRDRLEIEPDLTVVATASDADQGVTEALNHKPDVVLMDVAMPGLLSFDAARTIKAVCPDTRIVFLSSGSHRWDVEQALTLECAGFLTKDETPETVVAAIRAAMSGQVCFSASVQSQIVVDQGGVRLAAKQPSLLDLLTPREKEVLRYLAAGLSKKNAAKLMRISVKTVDRHAAALMGKLDIHDRVELTLFAIREGLARP